MPAPPWVEPIPEYRAFSPSSNIYILYCITTKICWWVGNGAMTKWVLGRERSHPAPHPSSSTWYIMSTAIPPIHFFPPCLGAAVFLEQNEEELTACSSNAIVVGASAHSRSQAVNSSCTLSADEHRVFYPSTVAFPPRTNMTNCPTRYSPWSRWYVGYKRG